MGTPRPPLAPWPSPPPPPAPPPAKPKTCRCWHRGQTLQDGRAPGGAAPWAVPQAPTPTPPRTYGLPTPPHTTMLQGGLGAGAARPAQGSWAHCLFLWACPMATLAPSLPQGTHSPLPRGRGRRGQGSTPLGKPSKALQGRGRVGEARGGCWLSVGHGSAWEHSPRQP